MSKFTFYSQTRFDGGVRSGIGSEGYTDLHHFEPGNDDFEPMLLWYIDITCDGESLPADIELFRNWLLEHKDYFAQILTDIAENKLGIGFDIELKPFQMNFSDGPDHSCIQITIAAIRRLVARDIANRLKKFIQDWEVLLRQLTPLAVA